MIFFVPDWDEYTGSGRGECTSTWRTRPPVLCATPAKKWLRPLTDLQERHEVHHEAYAAWRKEFNPWDNPKSSVAVFSRILELRDTPAKG